MIIIKFPFLDLFHIFISLFKLISYFNLLFCFISYFNFIFCLIPYFSILIFVMTLYFCFCSYFFLFFRNTIFVVVVVDEYFPFLTATMKLHLLILLLAIIVISVVGWGVDELRLSPDNSYFGNYTFYKSNYKIK